MDNYDIAVLGGGPGGYVAAIRAAQLGAKVALIEKDKLGGVCLNRGCIPTKALLKAAYSVNELKEFKALGINVTLDSLDATVAVKRAASISNRVNKGVHQLMKKNKIEILMGTGKLTSENTISVKDADGNESIINAKNIILATGAHYKTYPGLKHDGDRLIGAYEAIKMEELPKSIAIIGAGAIGVEMAYFWNAFGVSVHIFEIMPNLLPIEDADCSKEVERAYKKLGIKMSLGSDKVCAQNMGDTAMVTVTHKDGRQEEKSFDKCLIAVGMTGNISDIGLEEVGIKTEAGFVVTNEYKQTNVCNIYAIGDLSGPPLLAHVASHEGVVAAESIMGLDPHPIDTSAIPGCTYCMPQVASVGENEKTLKEKGVSYKIGKIPFISNGKAVASNEKSGFIKVLLDESGQLLGAHIVGANATELIHELTLAKRLKLTPQQITNTIHPHPTLGEWIPEAILMGDDCALHG